MISVEEAIHIIDKEIEPNKGIIKPLNDSLSYVLAKDVYFCIRRKQVELSIIVNRSQIVNINEDIWQKFHSDWAR